MSGRLSAAIYSGSRLGHFRVSRLRPIRSPSQRPAAADRGSPSLRLRPWHWLCSDPWHSNRNWHYGPPGRRRAAATDSEAATDQALTRTGEAQASESDRVVQPEPERPSPSRATVTVTARAATESATIY